jgi:hypothetical protein
MIVNGALSVPQVTGKGQSWGDQHPYLPKSCSRPLVGIKIPAEILGHLDGFAK